jgi:hypothetical protein
MSLLVTKMMKINFISQEHDFSISVLVKWILSVCLSIHTMEVRFLEQTNGFHNEMGRLKKLTKLKVMAYESSDLKEVTLVVFRIMTTLFRFLRRFSGAVASWKSFTWKYIASIWRIWLNGN